MLPSGLITRGKRLRVGLDPFGRILRVGVLPGAEPQQDQADIVVAAPATSKRVDPGEIEAALDRLDLFPGDGDLDRVGVQLVDDRPDLGQHGRIVAAVVGLRAEDQERRPSTISACLPSRSDEVRKLGCMRSAAGADNQQQAPIKQRAQDVPRFSPLLFASPLGSANARGERERGGACLASSRLVLWLAFGLNLLWRARASPKPTQEVVNKAPNGLALTPPMGWNSWNKFACNVNEQIVRDTADAMVSSGMRDAGYQYVVIDDCWQGPRDANGFITADPQRFPSGIKALADYVHSHGLKFGIYSDAGRLTCGGRPGSQGHEYQDALTYARWGVDYLKYDWCSTGDRNAQEAYAVMADALRQSGRPIVFSMCEWGTAKPWLWAKNTGNLWRTTGDIWDSFDKKDKAHRLGASGDRNRRSERALVALRRDPATGTMPTCSRSATAA